MKPYKATYPDGTTESLTKEEAIFVVRTARNALDPKPLERSRAEARGLLDLFTEGLDGLYFENVTVTISTERAWWMLAFNTLAAGFLLSAVWCMATGHFNEAAYMFMAGSFYGLLLLYVYRELTRTDCGSGRG